MAEITLLSAFLKVGTRGKVEMHLSVFSGLICDGDTNSFMIAISVLSQLFLQFTNFNLSGNQECIFFLLYVIDTVPDGI